MNTQLEVGARIYRPVRWAASPEGLGMALATPAIQDFGDGTTMLRAVPQAEFLPDWLAVDWETPGGRVCVCDEPIPPDWTYFEVLFADVNFAAVSPVAGDLEELRQKHLKAAGRGGEGGSAA